MSSAKLHPPRQPHELNSSSEPLHTCEPEEPRRRSTTERCKGASPLPLLELLLPALLLLQLLLLPLGVHAQTPPGPWNATTNGTCSGCQSCSATACIGCSTFSCQNCSQGSVVACPQGYNCNNCSASSPPSATTIGGCQAFSCYSRPSPPAPANATGMPPSPPPAPSGNWTTQPAADTAPSMALILGVSVGIGGSIVIATVATGWWLLRQRDKQYALPGQGKDGSEEGEKQEQAGGRQQVLRSPMGLPLPYLPAVQPPAGGPGTVGSGAGAAAVPPLPSRSAVGRGYPAHDVKWAPGGVYVPDPSVQAGLSASGEPKAAFVLLTARVAPDVAELASVPAPDKAAVGDAQAAAAAPGGGAVAPASPSSGDAKKDANDGKAPEEGSCFTKCFRCCSSPKAPKVP